MPSTLTLVVVATWAAMFAVPSTHAQDGPPVPPLRDACGVGKADFKMKAAGNGADPVQPVPGRALVYVIELMPEKVFVTTHVKLGLDGRWAGQLSGRTFMAFNLDPGVHHFCMRYEGKVASSDLDSTVLHRLDAEAGKTYYLLYRGFYTRDSGEIGLLDLVDEDEGQYTLQTSQRLIATP